jgi:hypothetical protein
MRNISDKSCRENQNRILFPVTFFSRKFWRYEIMWKNIVEPDWAQMIKWRMRFACWMAKATPTDSKYVILIALPW